MTASLALAPHQLYTACDLRGDAFEATQALPDLSEFIGQARALAAVQFGVGMRHEGYNLFVVGPPGVGKRSRVTQFLGSQAQGQDTPCDWCYVNNFSEAHKPCALKLPPGRGAEFRERVARMVEDLRTVLPPEEYEKLPEDEKQRIDAQVAVLQEQLQTLLRQFPGWRRQMRKQLRQLNHDTALLATEHLLDELREAYAELPMVIDYLQALQQDVVENATLFTKREGVPLPEELIGTLRRYQVNLLGRVEHLAQAPILQSLAGTGSVNQLGQVQAIGAVNHKIEGFFELCAARGLSGEQGVIIPAANVKHLMLKRAVVDAVAQNKFRIYAVETVDQAIEILTGVPAGLPDARGQLPEGSINFRVAVQLMQLSMIRQSYAGVEKVRHRRKKKPH